MYRQHSVTRAKTLPEMNSKGVLHSLKFSFEIQKKMYIRAFFWCNEKIMQCV